MNFTKKVKNVIREEGFLEIIPKGTEFVYRKTIRDLLSYKKGLYNGVEVPSYKSLDLLFIRKVNKHRPEYEEGIINGMNKLINQGDKVTIVGGGVGASTVKACNLSGDSSNVTVYEGSKNQINRMKRTFQLNGVDPKIRHSIVGPDIDIWDKEEEKTPRISPKELNECDLLELDCEGSELKILEKMKIQPKKN